MDHLPSGFIDLLRRHSRESDRLIQAFAEHNDRWVVRDLRPGEILCRTGDNAEAIWFIVSGKISIVHRGEWIRNRDDGELVGEQAFIRGMTGKSQTRTADMIAVGRVRLICIDASLNEQFSAEQRALWFLALASIANQKLEEATHDRSELQKFINDRDTLLERFADSDALALVKRSLEGGPITARSTEAIVWFSDVAGFSTWSKDKSPVEAAEVIKTITGLQIEVIRKSGGLIDKIMGDGLMAFWFVDTQQRLKSASSNAVSSAQQALALIDQFLRDKRLSCQLNIRIGMHCGPVVFGDFGSKNRIAVTILGETVNTAARYEQARGNELGRIRISPALRGHIISAGGHDHLSFGGPQKAKVKESKIEIYTIAERENGVE
jgi:class 3 adenylate cyclase